MPYIGPKAEVEVIFQDEHSNETLILYGRVDALGASLTNLSGNGGSAAGSLETYNGTGDGGGEDEYDSMGALTYVVAVIVVYGISMFLIVATYLRRKSAHKSLDGQVHSYIKGLEAARVQAKVIFDMV